MNMNEKILLQKIRALKDIEPSQQWVNSTYSSITGSSAKQAGIFEFIPQFSWKFAAATSFSFALIVFLIVPLLVLNNQNKQLEQQFQITQQKMSELKFAISDSQPEYEDSAILVEKIAKTLNETGVAIKLAQTNNESMKDLIPQAIEIQIQKQEAERVLAKKIEAPEWESSLKAIVATEIQDLETRTLSEGQQELFEQAKAEFSTGNFESALVKIYNLSYLQ